MISYTSRGIWPTRRGLSMKMVNVSKLKKVVAPYCWVLPAIAVLIGIMGYSWARGFLISLTDWRPMVRPVARFIGLKNYSDLFSDPLFRHSLLVSCVFTVGSVGAQMVLGFIGALLLHKLRFFKGAARTAALIPMMLAPAVAGLIWKLFMDMDFGILNYFLTVVGLPELGWIADKNLVLPSIIMVDVWQWTPFVILLLLAGLESLPEDPYEAAQLDGATRPQLFWHITVPLLRPLIVIVLLFRVTFSFRAFDTILLLARGGGPGNNALTISMYLYERAYVPFRLGMTAAVSYVILGVTLIMGIVILVLTRGGRESA